MRNPKHITCPSARNMSEMQAYATIPNGNISRQVFVIFARPLTPFLR
jgi:hypothetical protein